MSCAWIDYDNDGYLDLFVANREGENNFLYQNDGNGSFTKITADPIVSDGGGSYGCSWGDYDNDGFIDLFVANHNDDNVDNFLYRNNGDNTFRKIINGSIVNDGGNSRSCSWVDFDNDGYIDLYVTNGTGFSTFNNFLYQNLGNGLFSKITDEIISTENANSHGCMWGDYDNDGDEDLFISNFNSNNLLYRNDISEGSKFLQITDNAITGSGLESISGSWGDYDNDRDLDLFVANSEVANGLLRNDGTPDVPEQANFFKVDNGAIVTDVSASESGAWGDYDNDGDLDLFVANGQNASNNLYQNNGDGTFTKITSGVIINDGQSCQSAAWGDYDNDGFLDLFVASSVGNNFLYWNNGNSNNWINIRCSGTISNAAAIGARVEAKARLSGTPTWQMREISAQMGRGQNSLNVEFGLRDATVIDSLRIHWPSGIVFDTTNIAVNQFLTITERQFIRITEGDAVNDGGSSFGSSWADYDNDGDDDLFVTNSGTDNILYRNDGQGELTAVAANIIINSDGGTSQSSSWGDYDNDGDPDLFVTNFGNNFLYENNGGGSFIKIVDGDIVNTANGSQGSSWADIDQDGDLDLFVANIGDNELYRNEGNGNFTKIETGAIVTDGGNSAGCSWSDYDLDGDLDLFVANSGNENNFLYQNNGDGTFTAITSGDVVTDQGSSSGGSWADYDNDGDPDLIVTNLAGNILYENTGSNLISNDQTVVTADENNSFGSSWADYDNDGDLDLFIANTGNNALYRNNGDGSFTRINSGAIVNNGGFSFGSSWADYDRNGVPDIFVANSGSNNFLYQIADNGNHWVNVRLDATVSNQSAIGARVFLMADIAGKPVRQMRELSGQSGYFSQNSLDAAFGLGNTMAVDSIRVEWPSGAVNVFDENLTVNQFLTLRENNRPFVANSIPVITLTADIAEFEKDLEANPAVFFDQEDDPLAYTVFSTDEEIARVFISDAIFTVLLTSEVKTGQVEIAITADDGQVDDGRGNTETLVLSINRPPYIANEIPEQTLVARDTSEQLFIADLENIFVDPDEDQPVYSAFNSDSSIAISTITGTNLSISAGDSSGTTQMHITADDSRGGKEILSFIVRNITENTPPVLTGNLIPDQVILLDGPPFLRELNSLFTDSETSKLEFSASTPNLDVVSANVIQDTLIVTPRSIGLAAITVRANDGFGGEATTPFSVEVLESRRPKIDHIAVTTQMVNRPIPIEAVITDDEGALANADLHFRVAGEADFQTASLNMAPVNDTTSQVTGNIPANAITDRGAEYFISAQDTHHVANRIPPEGVFSIKVRLDGNGLVKSDPQPGGNEVTDYRLISIPLDLDNKAPAAVLEDNLGAFDPSHWRIFQWVSLAGGGLTRLEFENAIEIFPGSAFWLIVKEPGRVLDSGPGLTVSTSGKYAIPLNAGWNLIGNPFNFQTFAEDTLTDGTPIQLFAYNNGVWSDPLDPAENMLQPFEGYAVFSPSVNTLRIRPNPVDSTSNIVQKRHISSEEMPGWSIRIRAQCRSARDDNNIIAVDPGAAITLDQWDAPEPPTVGQYVSVYFPHPEWKTLNRNYSTDFRPESPEGDSWLFGVKSNIRDLVKLSFEGIENIPVDYEVHLLDETTKTTRDLRLKNHYALAANGENYPTRFTLFVGKTNYINSQLKDLQIIPESYALFQNFPNPFNPATTIRYSLPAPGRVTLKVYDILGREIRALLVKEYRDAGYQAAVWDGRNSAGNIVSSGVYFVKMESESFIQIRKMLMIR